MNDKHISGKSKRRQQKKLERESAATWEELKQLASDVNLGLALNIAIPQALSIPGIEENLPDVKLVKQNLDLLNKDTKRWQKELSDTYAKYSHRSGRCQPEDLGLVTHIMERCNGIAQEYQANGRPVAEAIIGEISKAEYAMLKKRQDALKQQQAAAAVAEQQEQQSAEGQK